MGKATSKYEMSRETEALFDFYKSVVDLESKCIEALETVYGEERSRQLYDNKYLKKIDALEDEIFAEIQSCVWEQLMTKQDGEAAIII